MQEGSRGLDSEIWTGAFWEMDFKSLNLRIMTFDNFSKYKQVLKTQISRFPYSQPNDRRNFSAQNANGNILGFFLATPWGLGYLVQNHAYCCIFAKKMPGSRIF